MLLPVNKISTRERVEIAVIYVGGILLMVLAFGAFVW
jgi:hypothetical protein